ncbi:MAG: amidohydrolase family protein [Planctomycetes bacterium]|nr:amidohydrolase family protein [Planctomycetota bacterium]
MRRRTFLKTAGLIGVAGALESPTQAAPVQQAAQPEKEMPRIIDTHVHLWDLNRFRLPWLAKDSPLARSHVIKDHQTATDGLNVVKGVYMEVDVDPAQHNAEADYVLDICQKANTPLVAAVIGGRPASDDFQKYIQRFRGNRFLKGVRQVLHNEAAKAGFCNTAPFVRGVQQLGEAGLSFDLCMRHGEIGDAVKLVETCKNTRFILDHCGNGPVYAKDRQPWQRDMERLARLTNVVACKISGIVVQAREKWTADDLAPVINHSLTAFGPDRVMFAGDWPVCTLKATFRQWVEALRSIVRNRKPEDNRKLFHDNAARVYGLK